MVDHERAVVQYVFVRDHHAFRIASRSRRVLQKENVRSAVGDFAWDRIDEVFGDNPTESGDVVDCRLRMPRLRFGQDWSSTIRGSLCSSRCRPPGNPWRCGPFCTGHSGSRENWADRRAPESSRRARSRKTRKSFPAPADRRAEDGPATRNHAPCANVRRSPSSGGGTPHRSSPQSDCR